MHDIKFDIFVPFENGDSELRETAILLINELTDDTNKIVIPIDGYGSIELKCSVASVKASEKLKKEYPSHFNNQYLEILHFEAKTSYGFEYKFADENEIEITEESFNEALITSIFESRFKNFLMFSQLAVPGSILTGTGIILRNGKHYHDFRPLSSSLLSVVFSKNDSWPYTRHVPLRKVWNYIVNSTSILTKKSETKIENGLNSFSYLIDNKSDSMQSLFWAMTGIEALYADGEIGIGYQIDSKAKVLLGEPNENKKLLKKLYNFRSKFIHGNMRIPVNSGFLTEDDEDEYEDEFYQMECLAARLLTATLQEIIDRDLKKFDFEFKLVE